MSRSCRGFADLEAAARHDAELREQRSRPCCSCSGCDPMIVGWQRRLTGYSGLRTHVSRRATYGRACERIVVGTAQEHAFAHPTKKRTNEEDHEQTLPQTSARQRRRHRRIANPCRRRHAGAAGQCRQGAAQLADEPPHQMRRYAAGASTGQHRSLKLAYAVAIGGTSANETCRRRWRKMAHLSVDQWGVVYKIDGRSGGMGIVWRMDRGRRSCRCRTAAPRCGATC